MSSNDESTCEEDLAPDLDTVLMKTPASPKRRKEEDLSRLKKTKLQEIESKSYRNLEGKEVEIEYSLQEYEMFRMKHGEKILDLQKRFTHLTNHLIALGKVLSSWKPRLIERFSPERERITWEGEILDYTGGFSPERELSRLGEKWQFWAVDTV
ncbi:hypothetical protein Lal_00018798 [Lupinus albus]|nr:hypothetical protein Lal_00018798 [Lupinus albus]